MNYTWKINALDAYPQFEGKTDAVFNVHWTRTADDDQGHTASVYGTQAIGLTEGPYTPFDQLTEQQVTVWIENAMGAAAVEAMNDTLARMIADQIAPPVVTLTPPWAA